MKDACCVVGGVKSFSSPIILPNWTAAAFPVSAAFRSMLDSETLPDSQISRSLSTPMMAISSGTLRLSIWHACRTATPARSLHARIPQGLGILFNQLAIFFTADQPS